VNVIKSWRQHWDEIPECPLKTYALERILAFVEGMGEAFKETLIDAFKISNGMPSSKPKTMASRKARLIQEQDQEQDQELHDISEVSTSLVHSVISLHASKSKPSPEEQEIFEYWQQIMQHSKSRLDKKRLIKIRQALNLGYSVEELKRAIDGCANTSFNMGQNERKQRYDSIDLIFRSADKIESFINNVSKSESAFMQIDNSFMLGAV